MRARVAASILAALGLCAGPLRAQDEIVSGTRLRVRADGMLPGEIVATVLSRTADSLVLGGPNMQPLRVAIGKLSSIEVSRGKSRSRGAVAGMKWGVPIATGLVAMGSSNIGKCGTSGGVHSCDLEPTLAEKAAVVMVLGGLSGAIYGAGIGALIGKERWDRFESARRTSLTLHHGRPGLGISLSF